MISKATQDFWKEYNALSNSLKKLSKKAYQLFKDNPSHPSLQFKKVNSDPDVYSVRITVHYRALCVKQDDTFIWFWIGNHDAYQRMINSL